MGGHAWWVRYGLPMLKGGPGAKVAACPAAPGALEHHEGAVHIFVGSSGGRAEDVGLQGALHITEDVGLYDCSF
jgi:hypothetical protein